MVSYIADLQVTIDDTYLILRRADLFDLETIAVDIGAPKKEIDACIDGDDGDPIKLLTHLITDLSSKFDAWDYEEQAKKTKPRNKKQKTDAFPADYMTENDPPPLDSAGGQTGKTEDRKRETRSRVLRRHDGRRF